MQRCSSNSLEFRQFKNILICFTEWKVTSQVIPERTVNIHEQDQL
jgi:hypothetical protein